MKKKLLFISRNLPPLIGGMETLSLNLAAGLCKKYDVTIIGPSRCTQFINNSAKVIEIPSSPPVFLLLATLWAFYLSARNSFSICVGTNGLIGPTCYLLKRFFHIKSVILVHGLDLVIDNTIYQKLFVPLTAKANLIVANSSATKKIAIEKKFAEANLTVINPGVTLPQKDIHLTRVRTDNPTILFVGRLLTRKGLSHFMEKCIPLISKEIPNYQLVIIGDEPQNAVKTDSAESTRVLQLISTLHLENNVSFWGRVDAPTLAQAYRTADVLIMPLIPTTGDIEGFGMVIIEAASYGTPTIAFNIGGVCDAIAHGKTGFLIEPLDYRSFSDAVVKTIAQPEKYRAACTEHAKKYEWENYSRHFCEVLETL